MKDSIRWWQMILIKIKIIPKIGKYTLQYSLLSQIKKFNKVDKG